MKKLTTAEKKLRGTDRPDRRPLEPKLDVEEPPMPPGLTSREREVWVEQVTYLKLMGVLTRADGIALKSLVVVSVQVDEVHALISGKHTQKVKSTQKEDVDRVHPLYPTYLALRRELRALWTCFGLDPMARTSVHTVRGGAGAAASAATGMNDGDGDTETRTGKAPGASGYFQ